MDCTIYRNESGFAALASQWNSLLARSRFNTLFLTWEWQTTWWRCLGSGELWLLAWHEDNELVGIAPLYLTVEKDGTRSLSIVGCLEVSDYLDLIIARGHERAVYEGLLAWLNGPDAPAWDVVDLCNLPQPSQAHDLLPQLAIQAGLEAVTSVEDVCPIISLPGDWESYLENNLSKKQRHEVRRKLRKIEREADVAWQLVDGAVDLDREMDAFIELHRLSTRDKEDFMTPEMEIFFREVAQAMHEAGWLSLSFLAIDQVRAASLLSFDYDGRILVYNSGYAPDLYADLSPGIVLTCFAIQHAIDSGHRIYDFLQGNEVYKYRFGGEDTLVYRTRIRRRDEDG